MRSKRIYVAGPYTKGDVILNTRAVILAADELALAGYIPFVPHLSLFWHMLCPHPVDFWYQYDMKWLELCDCLVRLPGESIGSNLEVARAKHLCIPVYKSVEEALYAGAYTDEEDKHGV